MFIRNIQLNNFLSYEPATPPLELKNLNVVIGPNGSGKSNLLEAISLLKHAPGQLQNPIREGGGLGQWLFKKDGKAAAEAYLSIDITYDSKKKYVNGAATLRYGLEFGHRGDNHFSILNETIGYPDLVANDELLGGSEGYDRYWRLHDTLYQPSTRHNQMPFYLVYANDGGNPAIIEQLSHIPRSKSIDWILMEPEKDKSILAQRKDPLQYPEITYLSGEFEKIAIYREWVFGAENPARRPQKTDLPSLWLEPDGGNLALALNRIREDSQAKRGLLEALRQLYDGIDDYGVSLTGGYAEVFLHEGKNKIPAMRLSDGALRYLSLLAVLLNPTPPPLVCIEEPELGLHPDIIPTLADILKDASARMQLIVTTHSEILVDALNDTPEYVVVCEKAPEGSALRRLDAVEGGGDTRALHKACREGFRKFLEKAGLSGGMPRILACGKWSQSRSAPGLFALSPA